MPNKRLTRELSRFQAREDCQGIELESVENQDNHFQVWFIKLTGAKGTLYQDEIYHLRVRFAPDYPIQAPEVEFIKPTPIHPHIYGNGHICLSILYQEWSPALTVESVCISILSMLSSCTEKKYPADNDLYMRAAPKSSQQSHWAFHDSKC